MMITHHMQVGFAAGALAPVQGAETSQASIVSAAIAPFSALSDPIRAGSSQPFGDILQAAEGDLVLAQDAAFAPPVQALHKRGFALPISDATDSLSFDMLEIALDQAPLVAVPPPSFVPPQGDFGPALAKGSAVPIPLAAGKAVAAPHPLMTGADLPLADMPAPNLAPQNLAPQNLASDIQTALPQGSAMPNITDAAAQGPLPRASMDAEFAVQTRAAMPEGEKTATQSLPIRGDAAAALPPEIAQAAQALDLPHHGSNADQDAPLQTHTPQPNIASLAQPPQPSPAQMAMLAAGYQETARPQDAARPNTRVPPLGLENDTHAPPQPAAVTAPTVAAPPANTIMMQNVFNHARLNPLESGQAAPPDDLLPAFGPEPRHASHAPMLSAPQAAAQTSAPQAALSAQILARAQAAQTGAIEFTLSPTELGQLRFEMRQTGETVQILLSAERPETLDLLRKNSDSLLNDFRMAGFSGASLSFGGWGGAGQGAQPMKEDTARSSAAPSQIAPDTPLPRAILGGAAGLNLRL